MSSKALQGLYNPKGKALLLTESRIYEVPFIARIQLLKKVAIQDHSIQGQLDERVYRLSLGE